MRALVQFGLANAGTAAVLVIFVALITWIWKNPRLAHALWLIVLLRLIAPPLFQLPLCAPDWLAQRSAPIQSSMLTEVDLPASPAESKGEGGHLKRDTGQSFALPVASSDTDHASARRAEPELVSPTLAPSSSSTSESSGSVPIPLFDLLSGLWLAGSVLYVAITAVRVRRFATAMNRSQFGAASWLQDEVFDLAKSLGLLRAPRLMIVEGALPPMIWSGWRPTLLVPRTLIESIDPTQRRLLLLHELLHLRRRDHLIRWFAVGVLALYWWNPFAWWAVRRLQNAEEECCDADVLAFHPQQSELYGEALLAVSEFVSCGSLPAAAVSVGVERKNHLKRRMIMILKGSRWPKLSRVRLAAVIGCGAVVLGITLTTAAAQVEPAPEINAATQVEKEQAEAKSQKPTTAIAPSATVPPKPVTAPQPSRKLASTPVSPSTPQPPAFLRYAPLQLRSTDDETQNILKQRYNAAVRSVQLYEYQYDINRTPLGNVLAAARNLLDAKLALGKASEDQTRALEDYLDFVTFSWRLAKARLDIGGATGFSPVDEAQAREAMFDAKLKLAQLLPKEKGKAPETTQPVLTAPAGLAESTRSVPAPAVTSGLVTAASASETRAAMLRAKPLEPAAGDDELHRLLKDRYNSALKSLQDQYGRTTIDSNTAITTVIVAARTLLDAELAMATVKEAVGIYERYLEFMRFFDDVAEKRWKFGTSSFGEFNAVHEARLDAEIKLMQARATSPPNPRRAAAFVQSLEVRVRIAEAEVAAARAVGQQGAAELKRALTNVKYRETQVTRVQQLRKQNAVSQNDVDEATHLRDDAASSVEAARASIAAAQAQVAIKVAQLEQVELELKQANEAGK